MKFTLVIIYLITTLLFVITTSGYKYKYENAQQNYIKSQNTIDSLKNILKKYQ